MSAEEIVRGLRELLPPQVDYAELVCAEGFAHGHHYVWEDPEPYIINAAADLIESLTAQLTTSQQRERAAVEDMTAMAYTIRQRGEHDDECCFACKYEIENVACDNYGGGEWECPGFDTDECFKWRGKDVGEQ